jgi:hypothetical protein
MRVSIIAPTTNERTTRQHHIFAAQGCACQIYVQGSAEITPPLDAFLALEHVRATALFLFHYLDKPYPLLEAVRRLQHGLVVLDLSDATATDEAPVHCADLCLVANVAQKRALHEETGYTWERICVLADRQDYEQALETTVEQAMQEILPQTAQTGTRTESRAIAQTVEDLEAILLLRDPALDRAAILERVRQAIQHQQAASGYGDDVTRLGPEALRPALTANDVTSEVYAFLLHSQAALDELAASASLREPEFHSSVPLVGQLIVAVRRFWNWMSAKWYVHGWMSQQMNFNTQAVDIIGELLHMQRSNERRIHELELELESLRDKERDGESVL